MTTTIDFHPPVPAAINRAITAGPLKAGLFVIEGLNSLSTTYFFYYIYFLMQEKFGFGAMQNFMLAATLGLIYGIVAIVSGRFAQRHGYLVALRLGILLMIASFALETQVTGLRWVLGLMITGNIGMCSTWPALEALVSEGEPRRRLPGLLGAYNIVWAIGSAFAYFTGGAIREAWGWNGMFLVPAVVQLVQLAIVFWIERRAPHQRPRGSNAADLTVPLANESLRSPVPPKTFLKMALLANPFAYLAINTVVSTVPTLSHNLGLTPMLAGFVCSVWMFVRAGAFVLLLLWPGWHYRFRFLAGSFAAMAASFALMLLAPSIWLLVLGEIVFGLAVGLMYYSSLFYSMDVGEAKGEHGGIHEAAIGAGCFAGPAMAACSLQFFPGNPGSGAWAVTFLLLSGLGGLYWLRFGNLQKAIVKQQVF